MPNSIEELEKATNILWPAGTTIPPNHRVQLSEMANGRLGLPHNLANLL